MMVNSAAHAPRGAKPFGSGGLAVQSTLVSLVAWGEGWHDWHHAYPYDYAAAEKHWLKQYNPTACLLDGLALCGHVRGRKRALGAWERRRREQRACEQSKDGGRGDG